MGLGDDGVRRFLSAKIRLAMIATVAVGALAGCSVWFINKYFWIEVQTVKERLWPPPTAEQVEVRQLRNIAGWFSLDCGHVRRHEDADRAIACAQKALAMRQRFYVAFDFVGIDSHGATGLAAGWRGVIYEATTDQPLGYSVPKPDVNRCEKPPYEKTDSRNRYMTCWTAADDKAIGRLTP